MTTSYLPIMLICMCVSIVCMAVGIILQQRKAPVTPQTAVSVESKQRKIIKIRWLLVAAGSIMIVWAILLLKLS
jgi:hypothetical protein